MKVILLAPTPPPAGGIASWTVRMKNIQLKNGWKVDIVDEKIISKREVFGKNNRINIFDEIKRCFRIWYDLYKKLQDEEAEVVHSCIPAGTTGMLREYICAIITKFKKKKFIIHYRCTISNMVRSKVALYIFKQLTKISDLVIVLNTPSLEFVKFYSNTDVVLIPNFIEENELMNLSDKNISDTIEKIVYVGGVIEEKGCYDILRVAKEFPYINFELIGKIDEAIYQEYIPNNVCLCGELNRLDVKKKLECADIFIFLTYFSGEGFSNALVEAMALGIPCIVTDWAANRDMIENKGGIIVPIKDVMATNIALKKLENNKYLRYEYSKWNIQKVSNSYTEKIVGDMYVNAYERVLK